MMHGNRSAPRPDVLYHYTNVDGALGLLNSRNVWAGHIDFTNDFLELKYSRKRIFEIFKKEDDKGDEDFWKPHLNEEKLKQVWGGVEAFIFSLCADGKKASQWRTYGAQGHGLAIGFDTRGLPEFFSEDVSIALLKIQYSDQQFRESVLRIVREFDTVVSTLVLDINGDAYRQFSEILYVALLGLSLSFKTRHHKDEEEYRIVYYKHAGQFSDQAFGDGNSTYETKFRAAGGPLLQVSEYIAPYVELPYSDAFPIRKIIVGSRVNERQIEKAIKKMPDGHCPWSVPLKTRTIKTTSMPRPFTIGWNMRSFPNITIPIRTGFRKIGWK